MTDTIDRLKAALADRYRIERELGQGGMAAVYLAEDLKHDRKVAVKVLRPELAAVLGAERFVQEIKTTAALQHPHILPLFDSGTADGFLYYVMPYVEGETLRAKLDRETQLGIDEGVKITAAVADALDYAHRHGVIHRDIKPENILLHDGRPMVADFGIALALSAAAGGRMTETGMSLGTPHYMSPEQATAEKEITARSDVYSLASVLYEMLTGQPPHLGGSAQQIIMKIVTDTARPVTELRKSVPPNVAAAVAKALEKLPADRFESAKAFGDALQDPTFSTTASTTSSSTGTAPAAGRWRTIAIAASAMALISAVLAVWSAVQPSPDPPVGRYPVMLDSAAPLAYWGSSESSRLALTPDGRELVYAGDVDGLGKTRQLFVRPLNSLASRPIPGTTQAHIPVVSWDGSQVAFLTIRPVAIQVASLRGGPAMTLVDSAVRSGPAWGPDEFVYYLGPGHMIRRVPGGGGPAEDVIALPDPGRDATYSWLRILPGGHGALVAKRPAQASDDARYVLLAVDLGTGRIGSSLQGVAGEFIGDVGVLVYVAVDGTLMAVPFDEDALAPRGRPRPLFGGVAVRGGRTDLTVAGASLAYTLPGVNAPETLSWVNRANGIITPVDTAWHDPELESFALSPDGSRLAITISSDNPDRQDVWIKQLDRGPVSRLTFGGVENRDPSWTADGRFVSYASKRDGRWSLWRRRADGVGAEELVADTSQNIIEARWSRNGAWLVASVAGQSSRDVLVMRLGADSALRPLLTDSHNEWEPDLSPDSRWLAYLSDETGTPQVFVRPFPDVRGGKWQISSDGGFDPVWSGNGRELFFRSSDGQTIQVADMTREPALAERSTVLHSAAGQTFELNFADRMFEVSGDGRRFLVSVQGTGDKSGNLVIVQNFLTELRTAMATTESQ